MKQQILTLLTGLLLCSNSIGQTWIPIATDAAGDGSVSALLDGTKLEYYYDQTADSLWFRVTTQTITSSQAAAVGVNIMLNIPGGGTTFNFWGTDNMNPFHRLLTTWVTGSAPSSYTGTIGIANAAGIAASNFTNLSTNNISINVNTSSKTIKLGLKRTDFITDTEFSGDTITCIAAAAVGSNTSWNDDIYSATGTMTLTRPTTEVTERRSLASSQPLVFPKPASNIITIKLHKPLNADVAILDMQGKVWTHQTLRNGFDILDISSLPPGLYTVRTTTNSTTDVQQFVKK